MEKPDEKQPTTWSSPDNRLPASSSVPTAGQVTATPRSEQPVSTAANERSAPFHSLRTEIRVWTRDLLIAIGLALVIIVFLYQPVKVEGTSMAPLLSDQERIFINKFVYRFEPIQRGDVVVFWYPLDHSKSFIKRVVGLPGEAVEIRQGTVYVDGKIVPEPYVPPQYEDLSDFGPVRVPKFSTDPRYSRWRTGAFLTAARRAQSRAAAAKSFSIPASPVTRKSSPTQAMPGRSSV